MEMCEGLKVRGRMRLEWGRKAMESRSGEHGGSVKVNSQGEAWNRSRSRSVKVRGEESKVNVRLNLKSGQVRVRSQGEARVRSQSQGSG